MKGLLGYAVRVYLRAVKNSAHPAPDLDKNTFRLLLSAGCNQSQHNLLNLDREKENYKNTFKEVTEVSYSRISLLKILLLTRALLYIDNEFSSSND